MLINFTSGVFNAGPLRPWRLYKFRWNDARDKYLGDLQDAGLLRWAMMQIWNRQGKAQLGFLFEYEDPDAFKRCQKSPMVQKNEKRSGLWRYRMEDPPHFALATSYTTTFEKNRSNAWGQ